MMKILLLATSLFLSTFLFGQNDSIPSAYQIDSLRAIRVTQEVQALLIPQFATYNFDTFFPVIDLWIDSCGYHEPTLRTIIMEEILQKQPIDLAIQDYFNEGYYENYRNRVLDSWEFNYHDFYKDNVVYYGFLPLRSPLDTMLKNRAVLLKDSTLNSPDEKLILQLFSEDLYVFEIEAIKKEYKNSYIGRYMRKEYRKERNLYPALLIGTGYYFPIGPHKTLPLSQTVSVGASNFIKNWIFDFLCNFRFPYHPKSYDFYALDSIYHLKTKSVINGNISLGYKMADFYVKNTHYMVHPKLGIGIEGINTKIYEEISEEEIKTYKPLSLDLFIGFTSHISVAKTSYIGLGIYYHFIPYNWDKRVKTKFDKNYMSIDLFWRI